MYEVSKTTLDWGFDPYKDKTEKRKKELEELEKRRLKAQPKKSTLLRRERKLKQMELEKTKEIEQKVKQQKEPEKSEKIQDLEKQEISQQKTDLEKVPKETPKEQATPVELSLEELCNKIAFTEIDTLFVKKNKEEIKKEKYQAPSYSFSSDAFQVLEMDEIEDQELECSFLESLGYTSNEALDALDMFNGDVENALIWLDHLPYLVVPPPSKSDANAEDESLTVNNPVDPPKQEFLSFLVKDSVFSKSHPPRKSVSSFHKFIQNQLRSEKQQETDPLHPQKTLGQGNESLQKEEIKTNSSTLTEEKQTDPLTNQIEGKTTNVNPSSESDSKKISFTERLKLAAKKVNLLSHHPSTSNVEKMPLPSKSLSKENSSSAPSLSLPPKSTSSDPNLHLHSVDTLISSHDQSTTENIDSPSNDQLDNSNVDNLPQSDFPHQKLQSIQPLQRDSEVKEDTKEPQLATTSQSTETIKEDSTPNLHVSSSLDSQPLPLTLSSSSEEEKVETKSFVNLETSPPPTSLPDHSSTTVRSNLIDLFPIPLLSTNNDTNQLLNQIRKNFLEDKQLENKNIVKLLDSPPLSQLNTDEEKDKEEKEDNFEDVPIKMPVSFLSSNKMIQSAFKKQARNQFEEKVGVLASLGPFPRDLAKQSLRNLYLENEKGSSFLPVTPIRPVSNFEKLRLRQQISQIEENSPQEILEDVKKVCFMMGDLPLDIQNSLFNIIRFASSKKTDHSATHGPNQTVGDSENDLSASDNHISNSFQPHRIPEENEFDDDDKDENTKIDSPSDEEEIDFNFKVFN